ncbi:MAG: DUF975 family protein [Sporolactobacillus sp.]
MRIRDIKKSARASLKGYWGTGVLITFLMFLIVGVVPQIFEGVVSGGFQNPHLYTEPIELLYSLLLVPFTVGTTWFYIALVRSEQPGVSDIFKNYQNLRFSGKLIWTYFLVGLFTVLWLLLFLVPGIIKSLAYSQTFYLLKDHPEYTATQAITESRRLMKGSKGHYFLLNLSFIGWAILATFLLFIGLLWVLPYLSASQSVFYNELIRTDEDMVLPVDPTDPQPLV